MTPAAEIAIVSLEEKHKRTFEKRIAPLRKKAGIVNLRLKAAESITASSYRVDCACIRSPISVKLRLWGYQSQRPADVLSRFYPEARRDVLTMQEMIQPHFIYSAKLLPNMFKANSIASFLSHLFTLQR